MRAYHIPAYYMFPLVSFGIIMYTQSFKFYELNTAQFYYTLQKSDVVAFSLVTLIDLSSVSFFHLLLFYFTCYPHRKILKHVRVLPTFVLNFPFLIYYAVIVTISIFDEETCREMYSDISVDQLQMYIFGYKRLYEIILEEYGYTGLDNGGIKVLANAIVNDPRHWIFLFGGYLLMIITAIVILILNWEIFVSYFILSDLKSMSNDIAIKYQAQNIDSTLILGVKQVLDVRINEDPDSDIDGPPNKHINRNHAKKNLVVYPNKPLFNIITLGYVCGVIIWICLFFVFSYTIYYTSLNRFVPAHWHTLVSTSSLKISSNEYQLALEDIAADVPIGRYLLDTRNPPLFPLVTGTIEYFCSYNFDKCSSKQISNYITTQNVTSKFENYTSKVVPTVVFVTFESLSPAPKYLDPDFVDNPQILKNGSPYSHYFLPNLKRYSYQGITFLGTSSWGLPTASGWHSLFTSEKPKLRGLNMMSSGKNDEEGFARRIKNLGYYSQYVAPSPLDFDGKVNWVYRGWFDEVHYYVPTAKQQRQLNLQTIARNSWLGDRVSTRQTMLAATIGFVQNGRLSVYDAAQKYSAAVNTTAAEAETAINELISEKLKSPAVGQPLIFYYANVDSHTPFKGYDTPENYAQFQADNDYTTMIQSADYHIGQMLDYITSIDPDTIVALTGDHGAREKYLFKGGQNVTNTSQFDPDCTKSVSGNDAIFATSAFISGPKKFIYLQNLTFAGYSDHDDFIATFEYLIYNISSKTRLPSSRLGSDLISVLCDYNKGDYLYYDRHNHKLSVSSTHAVIEARKDYKIFRGSMFGSYNGRLLNALYPTCIVRKYVEYMYDIYSYAVRRVRLTTHLADNNQIYNLGFENEACEIDPNSFEGTECNLANYSSMVKRGKSVIGIAFFTIFGIGGIVAILVTHCANKLRTST